MSAFTRLIPVAVVAIALGLALGVGNSPAAAATLAVTKTADSADGSCDLADCSLREAVIAANTNGVSSDTINLPAGTYTLALAGTGEDASALGDIDITNSLVINGAGAGTTTIDGGAIDRVLHVKAGTVAISGVTIQNGFVSSGGGGGIWMASGTLTLSDSTISGNTGNSQSGGIANSGTLSVIRSTISGNTVTGNGGGGAIYNTNGTLTVSNSTISGNTAATGGGISNYGTASVSNSTISDNTANPVNGVGGGLSSVGGTLTIRNSIVANNTAGPSSTYGPDCKGTILSAGYNLIESTGGCTINGDLAGNITGIDPFLGPLAVNAPGVAPTHKPNTGSPVLDAGASTDCPETDQRGAVRPLDGDGNNSAVCDIGAFEYGGGDADGDGVIEEDDNCFPVANPAQTDSDGDGIGDACDRSADVDCNGLITAVDALKLLRKTAGLSVAQTEPCPDIGVVLNLVGAEMGDIDCNRDENAVDALKVLRHVAGLSVSLPAGCSPIGS